MARRVPTKQNRTCIPEVNHAINLPTVGAVYAAGNWTQGLLRYSWKLALLKHVQRHTVLIAMLDLLSVLMSVE